MLAMVTRHLNVITTVIVFFKDAGYGYSPSECDNVIVFFMLAMVIRHLNMITLL